MAIRIRVYPQNGMYGAMGGMGAYGAMGGMGAVSAQTYYTEKLNTQQQVSNLRLGYERALFNQKLDNVRLQDRLQNPYAMAGAGMLGAYGAYPAMGVNPYAQSMLTGSLLGGLGGLTSGANFFGSLGGII